MSIDVSEVDKIARLAKLSVEDADKLPLSRELSSILALFEQLAAVDTHHLAPMAHPLDCVQRLREDEVTEADQRERLQANAPSVADGHYLVPKVIE